MVEIWAFGSRVGNKILDCRFDIVIDGAVAVMISHSYRGMLGLAVFRV